MLAAHVMALFAAASAAAPAPRAIPPAPGAPRFARFAGLDCRPCADSLSRNAFMSTLRGAFAQPSFPTERAGARPGAYRMSLPLTNRFRLLEGTSGEGAWQVQLTLDNRPAARRGDPGSRAAAEAGHAGTGGDLELAFYALSPEAVAAGVRAMPFRDRLALPGRPGAEFCARAGRAAALHVLEALHHLSGDLDADTRLRREPAAGPAAR